MSNDQDIFGDDGGSFDPYVFNIKPEPIQVVTQPKENQYLRQEAKNTGPLKSALIGAGRMTDNVLDGLTQMYLGSRNESSALDALKTKVDDKRALYAPLKEEHPFATSVGETAPFMLLPGAQTYGGAALYGALPGALGYGSADERLQNAGEGALAGVVGNGLGRGVVRLLKPVGQAVSPLLSNAASVLENAGIPLSFAQKTGSAFWKNVEAAQERLPLTAGDMANFQAAQKAAWNKAIGSTFGAPEAALTPDVMGAARSSVGNKFTQLASRNQISQQAGNKLVSDAANLTQDAARNSTPDVARIVSNKVDDVLSRFDTNTGTMPGEAYRALDSELGAMAKRSQGDASYYIGKLRGSLRDAMDSSISPADQKAWAAVRNQYANLSTVAPVAARSGTGDVTPAGLLQAVNSASKTAKFGGGGSLAELARAGKAVLTQVPDSGTAGRTFYQAALTSPIETLASLPFQAVPKLTYGLTMTPTGQAILNNGLLGVGRYVPEVSRGAAGRVGSTLSKAGLLSLQQ